MCRAGFEYDARLQKPRFRLIPLRHSGARACGVRAQPGVSVCWEFAAKEFEVLGLLVTRLSRREIGQRLYVSLNTVKTHQRALCRKLGVEDATRRSPGHASLGCSNPPSDIQVIRADPASAPGANDPAVITRVNRRYG